MTTPYNTDTIKDLHKELIQAHLLQKRRPELAINWLEKAYIVNAQNPDAQETNLVPLLDTLLSLPGTLQGSTIKAFEMALVNAIHNDKVNEGLYLDTAWHYVAVPGYEYRHAALNQLAQEIPYNRHKSQLNEKKRPTPQRLTMAMLLTQSEGESIGQTTKLVQFALVHERHKDLIPTLNHLCRLDKEAFAVFSNHYSNAHLQGFTHDTPFEADSDEKKELLRTIFRDSHSLMKHATLGLMLDLSRLRNLSELRDGTSPEDMQRTQSLMNLLAFARSDDAMPEFKSELTQKFRNICEDDDWLKEDIEASFLPIFNAFKRMMMQLDEIGIPWRESLHEAFCVVMKENNAPRADYFEAAGFMVHHAKNAPMRRVLALTALSEMPFEQMVETFKAGSRILDEMYKLTHDTRLLGHMNESEKRGCINHDLGI